MSHDPYKCERICLPDSPNPSHVSTPKPNPSDKLVSGNLSTSVCITNGAPSQQFELWNIWTTIYWSTYSHFSCPLSPEILCIRQVYYNPLTNLVTNLHLTSIPFPHKINRPMFRLSKLRAVWANACTSYILKRNTHSQVTNWLDFRCRPRIPYRLHLQTWVKVARRPLCTEANFISQCNIRYSCLYKYNLSLGMKQSGSCPFPRASGISSLSGTMMPVEIRRSVSGRSEEHFLMDCLSTQNQITMPLQPSAYSRTGQWHFREVFLSAKLPF